MGKVETDFGNVNDYALGISSSDEEISRVRVSSKKFVVSDNKVCTLKITGMMCSACSGTIERGLNAIDGVQTAQVQLLLESAHVCFDPSVVDAAAIAEEVEDLGFDCKVTNVLDESASTADLVVLHIYGAFVPAETFGPGVVASCQVAPRQYSVTYSAKLIGARKIMARAREADPLAEVETRQFKQVGMDKLLKGFLKALPAALIVFYLSALAPIELKKSLSFQVIPGMHFLTLIMICLSTPVLFISGKRFHAGAIRAIRNRNPNMEVLISVATNVAFLFSIGTTLFGIAVTVFAGIECAQPPPHFFEAPTTLICVMLLGKYIEGRAKSRTAKSLDRLMDLAPEMAHLKENNEDIPVALVELGDEIVVFPGERIPCDGVLVSGDIEVDESLLTGESTSVVKTDKKGDRVIGGSILLKGNATVLVDCIGEKTTVNQIVSLIETAQNTRAPVQQVADDIAALFVPVVLIIALVTTIVWACLVGFGCVHSSSMHFENDAFRSAEDCLFALKFGLAVLLVACPCAMGLATPTAVMVASSVSADHGVLIKSILPLENAKKMKVAVMDKTGTLTRGVPTVVGCTLLAPATDEGDHDASRVWDAIRADSARAEGLRLDEQTFGTPVVCGRGTTATFGDMQQARRDFWALVAVAESASEHPLAKAVLRACRWKGTEAPTKFVNGLRGIDAVVGDIEVRIGSESFARQKVQGIVDVFKPLAAWVSGMQDGGCTVVYVCANGVLLGAIAIEDNLAPGALQTVHALHARGVKVVMCTGDAKSTAMAVARALGIEEDAVFSEVLPQDKVRVVMHMQEKYGTTLMIGDGLNDAAALGQADVGVAVGCGAQVTLTAADVVLARSEITDLLSLVSLADATIHTVYRNFAFSFVFNVVLVPIAAGVLYPLGISISPIVAGLCMAASSLSVITSSLMLRRWKPTKRERVQPMMVGRKESALSILRKKFYVTSSRKSDHVPLPLEAAEAVDYCLEEYSLPL
eukprot:GEMP01005001.1.p1 GENE.GEMP01005001.1~~GEMP01005001.1.p1  ORF type:complete len:983 (+),score=252.48 GEMP01005001.1:210-3158(+)